MIRFCDKEVNCVTIEGLTRSRLFSYFLNEDKEDILCIVDESGQYIGNITYASLLRSNNVEESIQKEKLFLDEQIWENGRKLLCGYKSLIDEFVMMPVVSRDGQLLCFAYQDEDANREIRQLRELTECGQALNFRDIFPEYDCVTIWECNELAYYFAKYLQEIGVPVNVRGCIWEVFGIWGNCESLDYRNLNIYAEGTWQKSANIREVSMRSVSVEFECIDKIYEANITKGWIADADKTLEELIRSFKKETNIYLVGIDPESQDVYDFLLEKGIDIAGFITDGQDLHRQMVLGKPVHAWNDILDFRDAAIIECSQKHSVWGFGRADLYDYIGYHRNDRFFLIKDYYEQPKQSLLKHVLFNRRIVLLGDILLCSKIYTYLQNKADCYYCDLLDEGNIMEGCRLLEVKEIKIEDFCVLAVPEYFVPKNVCAGTRMKADFIARMRELGIMNYTDYFCNTVNLLKLERAIARNEWNYCPKGICIGAISYCCGNMLFRGVLEGHPQILMMDSCYLSDNLFSICLCLSAEKSENIASAFWKMIDHEADVLPVEMQNLFLDKERFSRKLEYELEKKGSFTSQELFVILHLAYASMWGNEPEDVSDTLIYWEPHLAPRDICEQFAEWLGSEYVPGYLVNVVRNGSIRAGSYLKFYEDKGRLQDLGIVAYWHMVDEVEPRKEMYNGYERIVIKFEDLKCNPQETLENLCHLLGIRWSDTFLKTTSHNAVISYMGITGFDIRPVYDTYEKYFTEYDRMRLMLLLYEWQTEYGYPCVDPLSFSRRELQEMFVKDFRFEEMYRYWDENDLWKYRMQKMDWVRRHIQLLQSRRKSQISCAGRGENKLVESVGV